MSRISGILTHLLMLLVPVLTVVVGRGSVVVLEGFVGPGGGLTLELHRKKETVLFLGPRKDRIRVCNIWSNITGL